MTKGAKSKPLNHCNVSGDRKRVSISLDSATYRRLQRARHANGFKSLGEMLAAYTRILPDLMEGKAGPPDDDAQYIEAMFEELGNAQRVPDGTVPVRHNNKKLK